MGDVALTSPVIENILKNIPDASIILVTPKVFFPFFNEHPRLTLVDFDKKKYKGLAGLYRFFKLLNTSFKPTHVVDLHDVLRTSILNTFFTLSGKKVLKIEKGRKEKKSMIKTKNTQIPLKHTTQRYLDVFNKISGINLINHNKDFKLIPKVKIDKFLSNHHLNIKTNQWIGIAPFAKHETKIWGKEKTSQLIEKLLEEQSTVFLFGGGVSELQLLDEFKLQYPSVIIASKSLSLKEEISLMSLLDSIITMDSSNMHIASLLGIKVISVWGSTNPSIGFAPLNNEKNIVMCEHKLSCQPCSVYGKTPCIMENHECMDLIKMEAIINKIKTIE